MGGGGGGSKNPLRKNENLHMGLFGLETNQKLKYLCIYYNITRNSAVVRLKVVFLMVVLFVEKGSIKVIH